MLDQGMVCRDILLSLSPGGPFTFHFATPFVSVFHNRHFSFVIGSIKPKHSDVVFYLSEEKFYTAIRLREDFHSNSMQCFFSAGRILLNKPEISQKIPNCVGPNCLSLIHSWHFKQTDGADRGPGEKARRTQIVGRCDTKISGFTLLNSDLMITLDFHQQLTAECLTCSESNNFSNL